MWDVMRRCILTALGTFLIVACQDSVIGPDEAIIGSWRANQGAETITWTFQSGGTLRVATETEAEGLSFFATRYTASGSNVTLQAFSGSDNQGNPVAFTAANCTAEINGSSLRLACDTGIATFTRVGPNSAAGQ